MFHVKHLPPRTFNPAIVFLLFLPIRFFKVFGELLSYDASVKKYFDASDTRIIPC